jgi:hypothetical protein
MQALATIHSFICAPQLWGKRHLLGLHSIQEQAQGCHVFQNIFNTVNKSFVLGWSCSVVLPTSPCDYMV